jgi:hypothetical protein
LFEREEVMKKFTFALMMAAVMLLAVSPLFAEGMMFGVKAGLNMANVTGSDAEGASMKMGMVGGAYMSYELSKMFVIQPELLYTMKGAKEKSVEEIGGVNVDIETSMKLNYLEIPLLFKVNFPTEGKIKPCLYAGPAFGILISAKAKAKASAEDASAEAEVDIKDLVKSTDFGIIAGAGVGYEMEKGMLFLEGRYEIGLTTIDNPPAGVIAGDVKNSVISIMVGYGFAF